MPHSEVFNAERRRLYAAGRRIGLTPREAGHLYNDRQAQPKIKAGLESVPPVAVTEMPDARGRLLRAVENHYKTRKDYIYHNYNQTYIKVKLKLRDSESGETKEERVTVALKEREIPNRDALFNQVEAIIARHRARYGDWALETITYDGIERYPAAYDSAHLNVNGLIPGTR